MNKFLDQTSKPKTIKPKPVVMSEWQKQLMKINDKISKHTEAGKLLYNEKNQHLKSFELQCRHCNALNKISELVCKVHQDYDDDPYNGAWYDNKDCSVTCPKCNQESSYIDSHGFGYVYELSSYFNRVERV